MYSFLEKLKSRAHQLGNHVRKYVRGIDLCGDCLVRRLEQAGLIDQVHLWKESQDPDYEMDIILSTSESFQEKLTFLGCYYGIQFLHLNLRALDVLFMNIAARQDRLQIYKDMQFQLGITFRRLNASYMRKLLDLYIAPNKRPCFAFCGVGTRYDQDDLDLGIIDDGSSRRKDLNQAIGHLNSEMIKWAVPLHLHLSQYVGEPGFSASIKEYQQLLQREIHDFIIISEMLSAKLILGDPDLFHQFEEQVTARYYYRANQCNIYHEGYLRGLLGEVRSLLLQQLRNEIITPKEDAIRMIRGLIYSEKTMFSIKSVNNYDILAELKHKDPARKEVYEELESALLFFETFRFLYQLLIIQDEEIPLNTSESENNLNLVADYMGYGRIGNIGAHERLLTHYYEYVALAKEKTEQIFDVVTAHLQSISSFSQLKRREHFANAEYPDDLNIAERFAELTHFFRGTKFWDDVMKTLEADDAGFLQILVNDLSKLPPDKKAAIITRYVEISQFSFYGILSLILVITRNQQQLADKTLINELNKYLFRSIKGTPDEARRLTKVFSHYPALLNNYISSLPECQQREFMKYLDIEIWEEEATIFRKKLLHLVKLHCCASEYFKRFFQKVVNKYPDCIFYLDEPETLKHLAKGFLGEVDRHLNIQAKKQALGDYYNIEFLRTGIELLNGATFSYVNTEFTDFSDTYLQTLFDICRLETDEEWAHQIATSDLLALYVTGGHARGQAFDDDYDIIVILDSDNEQLRHYSSRIVSRMNAEIIKRGVLPHFRFSEYTGFFITTFNELAQIISEKNDTTFIDQAQLLGSRLVVGSSLFDQNFDDQIIFPYILNQKKQFIQDMLTELSNRHTSHATYDFVHRNIKECLGGLRDIEMFFLILKAKFEILSPISNALIEQLCEADQAHSMQYKQLRILFNSLKHLRDIYRLTVTADDTLDPHYLDIPAQILGSSDGKVPGQVLLQQYYEWTKETNLIIQNTLNDLGMNYPTVHTIR